MILICRDLCSNVLGSSVEGDATQSRKTRDGIFWFVLFLSFHTFFDQNASNFPAKHGQHTEWAALRVVVVWAWTKHQRVSGEFPPIFVQNYLKNKTEFSWSVWEDQVPIAESELLPARQDESSSSSDSSCSSSDWKALVCLQSSGCRIFVRKVDLCWVLSSSVLVSSVQLPTSMSNTQ